MKSMQRVVLLAAVVSTTALLGATACSGDEGSGETGASTSSAPTSSSATAAAGDPAAGLVGPGCADYAAQVPDAAGSVGGMAQDPAALAASNIPMLKTPTQDVSGDLKPLVNPVGTLNCAECTVFAPV